ncbi:MAG: NUDIX domain-containing protein [Candidatus Competibacteraceae bacterium]
MPQQNQLELSTDVVLFNIRDERLEVLLLAQAGNGWRLPGGEVAVEEDLDAAARRYLTEQTGFCGGYLEQLYTFGYPPENRPHRIVAVAYYALVPVEPPPILTENAALRWYSVKELPALVLNHQQIIDLAHQRLVSKLSYSTIALLFMPSRFTLTALQSVYETILGEPLDKRNFRKRVLAMDCIENTGEMRREGKSPSGPAVSGEKSRQA